MAGCGGTGHRPVADCGSGQRSVWGWCWSGHRPVAGTCKHDSEHPGTVGDAEFFDEMEYHLSMTAQQS